MTATDPSRSAPAARANTAGAAAAVELPAGVVDAAPASMHPAAKLAYTTRHAVLSDAATLLQDGIAPRPGDLVLARVTAIGQHERLELRDGRRAMLYADDHVVVCYGNRYAPDQFEAEVPEDLSPCELVAAGGIAGRTLSRHPRVKEATRIAPVGILGDARGVALNLDRWALRRLASPSQRPRTVAVVGTAMNAGKTTIAANIVKGLCAAGHAVAAAKVTGTGAGGDTWLMKDAGADPVLDFTDAGHASTYLAGDVAVETIFDTLTAHLAWRGTEAIVLELSDGIFQPETAALLRSPVFADGVDQIVFAGVDAPGTVAGVDFVRGLALDVTAVGGLVASSPLAAREAALATGLPVLDGPILREPGALPGFVALAAVAPG